MGDEDEPQTVVAYVPVWLMCLACYRSWQLPPVMVQIGPDLYPRQPEITRRERCPWCSGEGGR